jgi:UDP-N-acetylmuramoyl-L-alanyl-D-glutamate--2,6-diaminopimelate ligase
LDSLIKDLPIELRQGEAEIDLTGLTDDSRSVQPGHLFIARPALGSDAAGDAIRFVPAAIEAGAVAVLLPAYAEDALDKLPDNLAVAVAEPGIAVDQRLCGRLAETFYDHPSRKLKLIGVTGTNGKTTTVTLTKHLLESAGHKTGLIGTVELDTGSPSGPTPATLTTPGSIQLSQLLAEMVDNGCAYCVMEVSSHALHQGRADHVRFAAAAFTNLTQDHLDYHGTMEAYADAKAILFEALDEEATAVLSTDGPLEFVNIMSRNCKAKIIHATIHTSNSEIEFHQAESNSSHTHAWPVSLSASSSICRFLNSWSRFEATIPMPGRHNLSNATLAITLAHAVSTISTEQMKRAIETCKPVPGRLEPVGPDWPKTSSPEPQASLPTVLVDYAHTPDALLNVGSAMRQLTKGKLITVFGCGGDRDRAKRPLMTKAAQQYAHIVVLTSDNPRTEDPQQILDDAAAGFDPISDKHIIADRTEAIRFAINLAEASDTVLIAGKGHEDYQIIGTTKHHFDDREQAAAALRDKVPYSA